MSTDQQDDSPRQQRTEISRLAKREGYRVVRWYKDHGISGYEMDPKLGLAVGPLGPGHVCGPGGLPLDVLDRPAGVLEEHEHNCWQLTHR